MKKPATLVPTLPLFVSLVFLAGTTPSPESDAACFSSTFGTVRDAETGQILPGAEVRVYTRYGEYLFSRNARSDGVYMVSLPAGDFRLSTTASKYVENNLNIRTECNGQYNRDLLLTPSRAYLFQSTSSSSGYLGKRSPWTPDIKSVSLTLYGLGLDRISSAQVVECAVEGYDRTLTRAGWLELDCGKARPYWEDWISERYNFTVTGSFVRRDCRATVTLGSPGAYGRSRPLTITHTGEAIGTAPYDDNKNCQLALRDDYNSPTLNIPPETYRLDIYPTITVGTATGMIRGVTAATANPDNVNVSGVEPQVMTLVAAGEPGMVFVTGEGFDRVTGGTVMRGEEVAPGLYVSDILRVAPDRIGLSLLAGAAAEPGSGYVLMLETENGWVETGFEITVEPPTPPM